MIQPIINFKGTKELKQAIRIAAASTGCASSSEFIKNILTENQLVSKELKKLSKKVVK